VNQNPTRLLGVGILIAGAVTAAVFLVPRAFTLAAGPEVELITLVKKAEAKGLELEVGDAGTLFSQRVFFERMQVSVDPLAGTARINCTLDFTGRLGDTTVSSLGLERIGFKSAGGDDWVAAHGLAPRLVRVVWALELRRRALEAGDTDALRRLNPHTADGGALPGELDEVLAVAERRYRAVNWLIRFEREGATVTEDFRLEGTSPQAPVDLKGSKRLFVDPDGEFFFPHGLM
jgi:hypothetical protein